MNDKKLGATGKFPQGKLKKGDEGEIRFAMTVYNGKIVMDFGKPVQWLGIDVETAREIANNILKKCDELEQKKP